MAIQPPTPMRYSERAGMPLSSEARGPVLPRERAEGKIDAARGLRTALDESIEAGVARVAKTADLPNEVIQELADTTGFTEGVEALKKEADEALNALEEKLQSNRTPVASEENPVPLRVVPEVEGEGHAVMEAIAHDEEARAQAVVAPAIDAAPPAEEVASVPSRADTVKVEVAEQPGKSERTPGEKISRSEFVHRMQVAQNIEETVDAINAFAGSASTFDSPSGAVSTIDAISAFEAIESGDFRVELLTDTTLQETGKRLVQAFKENRVEAALQKEAPAVQGLTRIASVEEFEILLGQLAEEKAKNILGRKSGEFSKTVTTMKAWAKRLRDMKTNAEDPELLPHIPSLEQWMPLRVEFRDAMDRVLEATKKEIEESEGWQRKLRNARESVALQNGIAAASFGGRRQAVLHTH